MENILITGTDRGIGLALAQEFLSHGCHVYAGQYMPEWPQLEELQKQYPDTLVIIPLDVSSITSVKNAYELVKGQTEQIDILINVAGISGGIERGLLGKTYSVNSVGAIRMVDTFLPLMQQGRKILCFFSSEAGSVALSDRSDMGQWLGYCSSKAQLNMAVRLMFNRLSPEGYKFRVYHPGGVNSYMTGQKGTGSDYEAEETAKAAYHQFTTKRPYEDVLLLTDVMGEIWAF